MLTFELNGQNIVCFEKGGYQSGQMGQTVNLLTYVFVGSNPAPPTFMIISGRSSVGRATAFQAVGRGFESLRPLSSRCSSEVEHFLGKEEVTGSIPVIGSIMIVKN